MNRARGTALGAVALLTLLAAGGAVRPARTAAPPRLPRSSACAWMADSLPGIGPRQRERAAEALRRGDLAALPAAARPAAQAVFSDL